MTEPDWLTERRRKGAALASELDLPTQKDKGWEFTDLSELDLDRYAPTEGRVEGLADSADSADGPPVVLPLRDAAERLGDVVQERFGSLVPPNDPFVARNEAQWRNGVLVYVPRGQRLAEPVRLSVLQDASGGALCRIESRFLATALWREYRRAREENRAERIGLLDRWCRAARFLGHSGRQFT